MISDNRHQIFWKSHSF